MADLIGEALSSKKEGQSLKPDDISGKRFLFHSFPKEFQDLHTNEFILEQRSEMDVNKISKAVLNSYFWLIMKDASLFGTVTGVAIVFAIIKMMISPNLNGFLIAWGMLFPWFLYTVYHFKYFAYIRAQVVGPVTDGIKKAVVDAFYVSFSAISISIVVMSLTVLSFLGDIGELFKELSKINTEISYLNINLSDYFLGAYEKILELGINERTSLLSYIIGNPYISAIIIVGLFGLCIWVYEKSVYIEHKKAMDHEIKKSKTASGYPIESALQCLWEWRARNKV